MNQLVACLNKFTNAKCPCIIAGELNCPVTDCLNNYSPSADIQDKLWDFSVSHRFVQLH
jgi:hypothetical protein